VLRNPPLYKSSRQETKKAGTDNDKKSKKALFSNLLETFAPQAGELGPLRDLAPSEEALTELMDAVRSAGDDLVDRPFHDEILKYKKAVRDFVHYIVENGYEVQKVMGIKKKVVILGEKEYKERTYHQIRVIDQELEMWAAKLLSEQTTKLERVSKIDEIRGLLVDLIVTGVIRERDE
jgi:uncharacterized protein YaaR (DUF327 family)